MLVSLWLHASTTALSAQWLAQRLRLTGVEEVSFLGGLMHDMGKLIILCAVDEMRKTGIMKKTISYDELQEFIMDNHCQIGYETMKRWEIPDVYCQIARDHHRLEFAAEDQALVIVRLANNSSSLLNNEDELVPFLAETSEVQALNIEEATLTELQKTLGIHKATAA